MIKLFVGTLILIEKMVLWAYKQNDNTNSKLKELLIFIIMMVLGIIGLMIVAVEGFIILVLGLLLGQMPDITELDMYYELEELNEKIHNYGKEEVEDEE